MSEVKIKELDKSLIHQANSNSMSGKRGDISAHEYEVYCQKVMSWNIPDSRKQKIVDQIYAKWSEQLRHEAAHVSVAVAGPARYNAKKLDHSDTILRLSSEFVEWFNGLQEQVWQGRIEDKDAKEIARLVDDIKFCIERPTLNPTESLRGHAKWVKDKELKFIIVDDENNSHEEPAIRCTHCNAKISQSDFDSWVWNFCPVCGFKMEDETEEQHETD